MFNLQVVLANKLDREIDASYVTIASPLFVSFSTLMLMSFGAKGANKCEINFESDCTIMIVFCICLQGGLESEKTFASFFLVFALCSKSTAI